MVFGILRPSAEEWHILERIERGEHLYISGVEGNSQTDAFTWEGNLSQERDVEGTHLGSRELNELRKGHWIVYDQQSNEAILTPEGRSALSLWELGSRGGVVRRR